MVEEWVPAPPAAKAGFWDSKPAVDARLRFAESCPPWPAWLPWPFVSEPPAAVLGAVKQAEKLVVSLKCKYG